MRDSFIFYRSFYESISELDEADKIALYGAICAYALDNIEPTLKGPAKAVFMLIRPQIDANTRKYENGCKGGRPPKKPKNNQTETKAERNDNDNDNENDNENDSAISRSAFGSFNNVMLSDDEMRELTERYERVGALINKVSKWLTRAKNPVPDHFDLCETFAVNESWPKRKRGDPSGPIVITDPLAPDEQDRKVAEMRERLGAAIKTV